MTDSLPLVDVKSNTVKHGDQTFVMRPLSDDAFTVMLEGVPVGRIVYTFGTGYNVIPAGGDVSRALVGDQSFQRVAYSQSFFYVFFLSNSFR